MNGQMEKEKIIDEMALDIWRTGGIDVEIAGAIAIELHNIGYRKEIQGEWKKPSRYSEPICTICKKSPCQYFGMLPPFCPNCGAKMKGAK